MSATSVILSPRQLEEFRQCEPILQEILCWIALNGWPPTEIYVRSIHRTPEENTADGATTLIHVVGPPFQAIDVRVKNLTDPQRAADAIGALVNARWQYDPTRPLKEVAFTAPHGTGPHIHLQTCPATTLRPGVASAT